MQPRLMSIINIIKVPQSTPVNTTNNPKFLLLKPMDLLLTKTSPATTKFLQPTSQSYMNPVIL